MRIVIQIFKYRYGTVRYRTGTYGTAPVPTVPTFFTFLYN